MKLAEAKKESGARPDLFYNQCKNRKVNSRKSRAGRTWHTIEEIKTPRKEKVNREKFA